MRCGEGHNRYITSPFLGIRLAIMGLVALPGMSHTATDRVCTKEDYLRAIVSAPSKPDRPKVRAIGRNQTLTLGKKLKQWERVFGYRMPGVECR